MPTNHDFADFTDMWLLIHASSVLRGLQAAEAVHSFALSLNEEAMLLAFDDYQGLLKRYARIPDWQKPLSKESFKPGAILSLPAGTPIAQSVKSVSGSSRITRGCYTMV